MASDGQAVGTSAHTVEEREVVSFGSTDAVVELWVTTRRRSLNRIVARATAVHGIGATEKRLFYIAYVILEGYWVCETVSIGVRPFKTLSLCGYDSHWSIRQAMKPLTSSVFII